MSSSRMHDVEQKKRGWTRTQHPLFLPTPKLG
jgi:hypothetical protein